MKKKKQNIFQQNIFLAIPMTKRWYISPWSSHGFSTSPFIPSADVSAPRHWPWTPTRSRSGSSRTPSSRWKDAGFCPAKTGILWCNPWRATSRPKMWMEPTEFRIPIAQLAIWPLKQRLWHEARIGNLYSIPGKYSEYIYMYQGYSNPL